jgi:hypothetical protein
MKAQLDDVIEKMRLNKRRTGELLKLLRKEEERARYLEAELKKCQLENQLARNRNQKNVAETGQTTH